MKKLIHFIREDMQLFDVGAYFKKIRSYVMSASPKIPLHLLGNKVRLVNAYNIQKKSSDTIYLVLVDEIRLETNVVSDNAESGVFAKLLLDGRVLAIDGVPTKTNEKHSFIITPDTEVQIAR